MDDDQEHREPRLMIWTIGALALAAWFAMLWFMFGDVI
jgi:hypothetical protein